MDALIKAIENGHIEVVKELIDRGVYINNVTTKEKPFLIWAIEQGQTEIFRRLIERGANINTRDNQGRTSLMFAKYAEVVQELVERGIDINTKDYGGWSALMYACYNGYVEVVQELINRGADINARTKKGNTGLIIASQNGHTEVVKEFLERGADINTKNDNGYTLLIWASRNGYIKLVRELIKMGADVIGSKANIKVVKNKMAPPFKTCTVDIMYGEGVSKSGEIVDMASEFGILEKSGAWYAYKGEKVGQGRENVKDWLKKNPDIASEIENKIRAHFDEPSKKEKEVEE